MDVEFSLFVVIYSKMALVKKIPALRSFYLVCVLHCCLFIQGSYGNHAVKPMLFINFFDDESGSETVSSPNENENEIKAFSDEGQTNDFLHDSYSAISVYTTNPTETDKSSVSTELNHPENAMSAFFGNSVNEETGAVKFESPSGDKTEPGMSAEGFDNPESCDNIPLQMTRIYFKAIATLIQHIMDAIFTVNETPNSRLAPMFEDDSSPSRRLRKRDIPPGSEVSDSTKQSDPEVKSSTHADTSSKNIQTHDSSEVPVITPENNLVTLKQLNEEDKIVKISTNSSTKIELPHVGINSTTEINFVSVKAEDKHESTLKTVHEETEQKSSTIGPTAHSSLGSTSLKQSTSSPTGKLVTADEKKRIPQNDEIVSNADLLKGDPSFLLYDQTSGEKQELKFQESRHFYPIEPAEIQPKLVEHSEEEKDSQDVESSSTGVVFAMTGIVLAVIVVEKNYLLYYSMRDIVTAFVGAAAAYTYVWKNNSYRHQGQHAGPGPSSQRSAMA